MITRRIDTKINKNDIEELKLKWKLDEGIAELVYIFNQIGFQTVYSCQGHVEKNKPYIMFNSDERIVHDVIKKLYDINSKNYSRYLDIGVFVKLCNPMCCTCDSGNYFQINDKWLWEGTYWKVDDYQFKINRFINYLKQCL